MNQRPDQRRTRSRQGAASATCTADKGGASRCLSGSLWITQDGDRPRHRAGSRRGVRLRPPRRRPAQRLRRFTLPAARRPELSLNRPFDRVGERQGHDLDAFLAQRIGILARGPAANAALLDLAVMDAARFLGEALADVFGRCSAPGAPRAAIATAASPRVLASARAASRPARGVARDLQARRARQPHRLGVAAQRAGDERALLLRRRNPPPTRTSLRRHAAGRSAGSGPSWRALWSGRRAARLPTSGASGRRASSASQSRPIRRLGVGELAALRRRVELFGAGVEDVEELAGVEAALAGVEAAREPDLDRPRSE